MRIQHNIMAMNAYRNYNNNTSALSKNLEKLSSGYKINRAGDDAAGLAISEKMRAQITGLNAAQKNVKDGISLVKTAEGAMQEIQDMLNRMDYLATQSANGTYDNEVDRANLNKEMDALKKEIDRIADSANFNGIKLLDGSLDGTSAQTKADSAAAAAEAAQAAAENPAFETAYKSVSTEDIQTKYMLKDSTTDATKVGIQTVLETTAPESGEKAGFSISMDGISHVVKETGGSKAIQITVNDKSLKLTEEQMYKKDGTQAVAGDELDAEDLAYSFAKQYSTGWDVGTGKEPSTSSTNGFDVKADGSRIVFEANSKNTLKNPHYDVTFTGQAQTSEAAVADVYKTGTISQTGSTANKDAVATIKYIDKDGNEQSADIEFKSGANANDTATALRTAIKADDDLKDLFGAGGTGANITLTSKVEGATVKVTDVSIKTAGENVVAIAEGKTTTAGLDAYTAGTTGYANAGTEVTIQATAAVGDQLASTTLTLTAEDFQDGTKIRLGDETYTIAVGEDSAYKDAENAVYIDGLKADDSDFLNKMASELAHVAKNNTTFTVSHEGTGGEIGLKQLAGRKGDTNMETMKDFASYIGIEKVDAETTAANKAAAVEKAQAEADKLNEAAAAAKDKVGKPLTLQIGDTSDKFNQMEVSIGDMHVNAMGTGKATLDGEEIEITKTIDDIKITDQDSAAEAVQVIKNAINYVSSVRGDLGAIQNRLEHTQNNLSVMAENIQDAESTIRDTDVAEEMMSYVKNNILVQSAQAMLAQANQVPQGVLQLLG